MESQRPRWINHKCPATSCCLRSLTAVDLLQSMHRITHDDVLCLLVNSWLTQIQKHSLCRNEEQGRFTLGKFFALAIPKLEVELFQGCHEAKDKPPAQERIRVNVRHLTGDNGRNPEGQRLLADATHTGSAHVSDHLRSLPSSERA